MIEGHTYQKGERKRTVIGLEGYFVVYQTHSSRPRTVGEAVWLARKWFDKAKDITAGSDTE